MLQWRGRPVPGDGGHQCDRWLEVREVLLVEVVFISEVSASVLPRIHRRAIPVRDSSVVRAVNISRPCKRPFSPDYSFADML